MTQTRIIIIVFSLIFCVIFATLAVIFREAGARIELLEVRLDRLQRITNGEGVQAYGIVERKILDETGNNATLLVTYQDADGTWYHQQLTQVSVPVFNQTYEGRLIEIRYLNSQPEHFTTVPVTFELEETRTLLNTTASIRVLLGAALGILIAAEIALIILFRQSEREYRTWGKHYS